MKRKILIIEDDKEVREELEILLENAGYEVKTITDFENVVEQVLKINPHLILLDVNLPGKSGYEICTKIRMKMKTPIIFVTSKNSAMDELNGLTVGGDDYIEKPYNVPVLLARINKMMKRVYPEENEVLEYKGITLEILTGALIYNEQNIKMITCFYFEI